MPNGTIAPAGANPYPFDSDLWHAHNKQKEALYRVEHQGWIASEWGESENKRKAKYYRLTAAERRRLQAEAEKWNRMADVIAAILQTKPEQICLSCLLLRFTCASTDFRS